MTTPLLILVIDNMAETCCLVDPDTLDIVHEWLDTRDDTVTDAMYYTDATPELRGTHWMTYDDWQEAKELRR